jgi:hypothetical protein
MKHAEKLKSPLFAGDCERIIIDKSPYLESLLKSNFAEYSQFNATDLSDQTSFDNEFLMSIYNNVDQGAQLITKMKMCMKNKPFLQKSIEQLANDASAAVFAVYIKHYRRIELVKLELSQNDAERAHNQLIYLFTNMPIMSIHYLLQQRLKVSGVARGRAIGQLPTNLKGIAQAFF